MTSHDSHLPRRGGRTTALSAAYGLTVMVTVTVNVAVESQEVGETATDSGMDRAIDSGVPNRVNRLQDSLATTQEWEIGVSEVRPATTFEQRIRKGSALDSQAYLSLDSELRRAQLALAERPRDRQAQQRLVEVQRALAARVESNMTLGYFYAARVYIALLEDAGAPPDQISNYRRQLAEISQS